jgi:hypothetical protein
METREEWPRYHVGLAYGVPVVRFSSTNPESIEREARRLWEVGLEVRRHFALKLPEGGRAGYVYILKEGLARAAWLSINGSGRQRRLAAEFVEYVLRRAREEGWEVYEKVLEAVKAGRARGSLRLRGFEGAVKVEGKKHVVKIIDGWAEFERNRGSRHLLRIRITAEVDGVRGDYVMAFSRRFRNAAACHAAARTPGGREADAERFAAVIKALTGKEPRVHRWGDGGIVVECGKEHLEALASYAELADVVTKWLEE